MDTFTVDGIEPYYENYKVKVGRKWYFITPKKLNEMIRGIKLEGDIVKKRTRTWIE